MTERDHAFAWKDGEAKKEIIPALVQGIARGDVIGLDEAETQRGKEKA